jgi:hypothetical protein
MKKYNYSTIAELGERGYHIRHIAIVIGCVEDTVRKVLKKSNSIEHTLKFITYEQKQRLLVLDKLLQLKPVRPKWSSDDYHYVSILKFLLVPRETIYELYKHAPMEQLAKAHRQLSPKFKLFDYTCIGITSEEWNLFVASCYFIIGDITKWR